MPPVESLRFGESLRHKRMAKGMSLEKVAELLHLDIAKINALENEAYDQLPEPIYTKGYIRNYARLLELDVAPLLQIYESCVNDPECSEKIDYQAAVTKSATEHSPTLRRIINTAMVGLALIAAAWFWLNGNNQPVSIDANGDEKNLVISPSITEPPSVESSVAPAAISVEIPVEVFEESSEEVTEEIPQAATIVQDETEVESTEAVDEIPPAQVSEITLRVAEDSWVEITDSTKKRLIFNLLSAGKVRTVTGIPPFQVRLGFAEGVVIVVNGEVFNHAPYIHNKTARFTIN